MKKIWSLILIASLIFSSCKKEEATTTEKWEFTKLVNANLDNNGNLESLDFYQKKGDTWRILQFEPDDYTTFYLKDSIIPNNYQLPINNINAFITSNVKLFNPAENKLYVPNIIRWLAGEPVAFDASISFTEVFPDLPSNWNTISKISAASYSYENAYDNNGKTDTYIFYDFPNQKYMYYGFKTGADLIIENTLPLMCPTCSTINWSTIDAVTCTGGSNNNEDYYYFFDFDAQQMYVISRIYKNTNHPSFSIDNNPISFKNAFFKSNDANRVAFDFNN